jgi:hypothetical protein
VGRTPTYPALCSAVAFALALTPAAHAQIYSENLPLSHPAIRYFDGSFDDPATHLAGELESGGIKLDFRAGALGYLPSLLEHLGVNADSQALVFSKTSFQAYRISPRNPRAIYFNDSVAVGYVPSGEVLEVAALDPRQGVVFYTLDTQKTDRPLLNRREACLSCHQGPATQGVPGILVGSVYPNVLGMPSPVGAIITDHRTPFEDRWGGWFLDYTHPTVDGGGILGALGPRSRVDSVASDPAEPETLDAEGTLKLTLLTKRFDKANYPTPISDKVALMTLEHQTQMANLLTRLAWEARISHHEGKTVDPDVEAVVRYMLFVEEAPLPEAIVAVSTFAKTFPQRGPRDRQGRSLRDFDLQRRLFRYPLSYMVYSPAFDALPGSVRERIYHRLYDVLSGKDQSQKFVTLSAEDRRAVLEILRETKPDLPTWWGGPPGPRGTPPSRR